MVRRSSRALVLLSVIIDVLFVQGCGESQYDGPSPTPTPTLAILEIQGNTELTAVGQTSQLRAVARWSDGQSTDVTNETVWSINGPPAAFGTLARGVASISTTGVLRATELGMAYVRATYSVGRMDVRLTVTPAGTFVVAGRAREPGASSLVDVLVSELVSGQSTTTIGGDGAFMLAGLIGTELKLTKDNYETVVTSVRRFDDLLSVPMQPLHRIVAGGSLSGTIAPNDLSYEVMPGTHCGICRLVRIQSNGAGRLTLTLRWTNLATRMTVWAGSQVFQPAPGSTEVVATFPMSPGETLVYVGAANTSMHVNFDLNTAFTPS